MCRRSKMDSCNFRNEGLQFFSRTAPMILPNSFDVKKTQVRSQEKAFVFSKKRIALFKKSNSPFPKNEPMIFQRKVK